MCGEIMASDHENNALIFKALCDEKRLQILNLLQSGEKCACVLTDLTNIKQSALSYHMKILCDSNIVVGKQSGKWIHYSISEKGSEEAIELLKKLTAINAQQECSG